ncbi:hypothetical protein NEF87_001472 [Candidatus Lokiarchaeum ossiferum]|uniref:AEC family transporter n=1 Tax=Candidatus Lokiarchaeum ossiferum TaxID=2951803 RepID=A0ABY6HS22_9ARCH|nr:hypothetical protein NEF87_001472 [Candidatus Lokiarchaeum sp. B-35]
MASVNFTFFLSFSIIMLGFFLRQVKIFRIEDGRTLSKIIINITLPAVILNTISKIQIDFSLGIMPLICLIYTIIVLGFNMIVSRNLVPQDKGVLLMTVITFNVGNFAYPIFEGIWGEIGLAYAAMFDIGNAFVIFALCYIIAAINSPKNLVEEKKPEIKVILKKALTSPPLVSYFLALLLNILHLTIHPSITAFLDVFAKANMGIVLLCLGILLDFHFNKQQWHSILQIFLIRYSFGIGFGLLCYFFLPFSELVRTLIFILLILPVGMSIIPYGVEFGFDEQKIATICNLTIIISFLLMWLIIGIFGTGL